MVYFEPAYWLGICIYMIVMSRGQTQLLHSESSERQLKILDYFCIHTLSPSYHVILFQHPTNNICCLRYIIYAKEFSYCSVQLAWLVCSTRPLVHWAIAHVSFSHIKQAIWAPLVHNSWPNKSAEWWIYMMSMAWWRCISVDLLAKLALVLVPHDRQSTRRITGIYVKSMIYGPTAQDRYRYRYPQTWSRYGYALYELCDPYVHW